MMPTGCLMSLQNEFDWLCKYYVNISRETAVWLARIGVTSLMLFISLLLCPPTKTLVDEAARSKNPTEEQNSEPKNWSSDVWLKIVWLNKSELPFCRYLICILPLSLHSNSFKQQCGEASIQHPSSNDPCKGMIYSVNEKYSSPDECLPLGVSHECALDFDTQLAKRRWYPSPLKLGDRTVLTPLSSPLSQLVCWRI